jgi:methylenetetrahydrofolate dehydrogenase (NADP+)/methenyltetrahydrofolate cyclohydrolase
MPARLLDGRALAQDLREEVTVRAARVRGWGAAPRLAVEIVGEDPASHAYARTIQRIGAKVGIDVQVDALPADITANNLRRRLWELDRDQSVHGVILQQPLPPHLDGQREYIAHAIPADKDVDGANPLNLGRLTFRENPWFVAATPEAVMLLLARSARWPLRGVRCCVVGRSTTVGLPLALLLLAQDATITIAHRQTRELGKRTSEAEVLIAAAGVPGLIRADMVAPGATVIDVGTTFADGKLVGDVVFDEVAEVAGEITSVPGGVGPVTNLVLLRNVVKTAEARTQPREVTD